MKFFLWPTGTDPGKAEAFYIRGQLLDRLSRLGVEDLTASRVCDTVEQLGADVFLLLGVWWHVKDPLRYEAAKEIADRSPAWKSRYETVERITFD